MRIRQLALVATACLAASTPAHADIVILSDGRVLPEKFSATLDRDAYPSDDALQESGRGNVDLRYDKVKLGRDTVSAALVKDVYGTEASRNATFSHALNQARSGYWADAAASFLAAAEELRGSDRQIALWNRLLAERGTGLVDGAEKAANELIAAFPEGYYVPQAHFTLARVSMSRGKAPAARASLQAVIDLPNINARDRYEAAVSMIDFFEFPTARSAEQFAKVEKAYRAIVTEIGARSASEAGVPLMKAQVGVARCLVRQDKPTEAAPFFLEVTRSPASLSDKTLLAAAYRGLGDVIYADARKASAAFKGKEVTPEQTAKLIDQLDDAAVHYMRVAFFYRADANESLQPAFRSAAEVVEWQHDLAGKRDEEALARLDRAVSLYAEAHKLMSDGEEKRALTTHLKSLIDKRDGLKEDLAKPADAAGATK